MKTILRILTLATVASFIYACYLLNTGSNAEGLGMLMASFFFGAFAGGLNE